MHDNHTATVPPEQLHMPCYSALGSLSIVGDVRTSYCPAILHGEQCLAPLERPDMSWGRSVRHAAIEQHKVIDTCIIAARAVG